MCISNIENFSNQTPITQAHFVKQEQGETMENASLG